MGKTKKATRKFKDKQLHGAIQKRRKHASVKRQQAAKATHKANARESQIADEKEKKSRRLEDLGVDDFLDGGFEDDDEDDVGSGSDGGADDDLDALSDSEEGDDGDDGDADEDAAVSEGADDDNDDGIMDEGAQAVAADNKRLKSSVSRHRSELEALREKDPEFFKYLQQTDAGLLDFGGDEDDDEGEEDDEDEDDEGEDDEKPDAKKAKAGKKDAAAKKADGKKAKGAAADEDDDEEDGKDVEGERRTVTVTSDLVDKWIAGVSGPTPGLGAVRQLVKAYRLACHYGDAGGDDGEADGEGASNMRINSASVYNKLMIYMLKEADGVFRRVLGLDKKKEPAAEDVAKSSRWRKVGPLIKSFWGNSLHLLRALTDAPLIAFALRRLRASVVLLAPFKPLADRLLKAALGFFGGSDDPAPRVQAFLCIRTLALTLPQPAMDRCLKGTYRAYLSNSKFVSAASAPHIAFMATCCVELWGCGDGAAAYEHAFGAVRQLALALRNALSLKTTDAYKEVYCWQGVNCLELWGKILGAHYKTRTELRPLVYPLTQLLLGAARLVPTPRYFPLRLRLVRALNRLSIATGLFVPVAPILLEMLRWRDLHQAPKGGVGMVPDMSLQLRVGKSLLRTTGFQEEVLQQVVELLTEHLCQWSCSVAFPELSHLTLLQLRKFIKTSTVERFRRTTRQLVDAVAANATWVGRQRDKAEFSPKDAAQVAAFLADEASHSKSPLVVYSKQLMARAAQRQAMRAAAQVDVGGKGGKKRKGRGDDDSDDDEDADDGSDDGGDGDDGSDDSADAPIGVDAEGEGADEDGPGGTGGSDSDDDGGRPSKKAKAAAAKKAKLAKDVASAGRKKGAATAVADGEDGEIQGMSEDEDVLGDYVLSDEGEDEEPRARSKASVPSAMEDDEAASGSGSEGDGEDEDDDEGGEDDDEDDDDDDDDDGGGGGDGYGGGRMDDSGGDDDNDGDEEDDDDEEGGGRGRGREASHRGGGGGRGFGGGRSGSQNGFSGRGYNGGRSGSQDGGGGRGRSQSPGRGGRSFGRGGGGRGGGGRSASGGDRDEGGGGRGGSRGGRDGGFRGGGRSSSRGGRDGGGGGFRGGGGRGGGGGRFGSGGDGGGGRGRGGGFGRGRGRSDGGDGGGGGGGDGSGFAGRSGGRGGGRFGGGGGRGGRGGGGGGGRGRGGGGGRFGGGRGRGR